jgi:hypothetical protein
MSSPDDIRQREVADTLDAGESLLWAGVPKAGLYLRTNDLYLIPFSLLWGGFAIFWEYSVLSATGPNEPFMAVWGIPFVLAGLYLIVGRFFVDARVRSRTAYALTNRRILIISGLFSRSTTSLQLRGLTDVTLSARGDGSGTIQFGRPIANGWASGGGWPGTSRNSPPAFELIPAVRQVHQMILEAQRNAA